MDISEYQFKVGGLSENDYLMIEVQLLQFENDLEAAQLAQGARAVGSAATSWAMRIRLRRLRRGGCVRLPADEGQPRRFANAGLIQNRPDLRAAVQGVTAANSGYVLAKADGKPDVTVHGELHPVAMAD